MVDQPDVACVEARKILKERLGINSIISANFEKRLASWPKINPSDAVALQEFSAFLHQVLIASKHIDTLKVYNNPSQIIPRLKKLPSWFKPKWSEKVMKFQKTNGKETFPSSEEFVNYVSHEAERTNIPQLFPAAEPTTKKAGDISKRRPLSHITVLASAVTETDSPDPSLSGKYVDLSPSTKKDDQPPPLKPPVEPTTFCFYHERPSHALKDCEKFQKFSFRERKEFLMSRRICLKCVNSNKHIARNCDQKELECKICKRKHPKCLHNPSKYDDNKDDEQSKSARSKVCEKNQS